MEVSHNWLQSQHRSHVGRGIASLFSCHSLPHLGIYSRTFTTRMKLFIKKKATFVEKAPLNSQWCWSRFSVFAKDHSQREVKKKCHKWLRSFQPCWNPWLPFTVWNLYGLNIYCWQIRKSKLCFCRRNRKFLSGLDKEYGVLWKFWTPHRLAIINTFLSYNVSNHFNFSWTSGLWIIKLTSPMPSVQKN